MNRTAEFRSPWPRSALGPTGHPFGDGLHGARGSLRVPRLRPPLGAGQAGPQVL